MAPTSVRAQQRQLYWIESMWNTRLIGVGIVLTMAVSGRADFSLSRFSFGEPHMGTWFKITLYASDEQASQRAAREAFDRIAALDQKLTDYNSESELMRLCQKSGGARVPVSEELFFILARAQDLSRRSGGAFDVTVGPVVRLWRRARRTGRLPEAQQIAEARELVGYRMVQLDEQRHTVQLQKAGMRLDLGGIAKGYAADEALIVLKRRGITSALVAAGGDIAVSAPPPDAPGWKIAVARLGDAPSAPSSQVILHNAAISTSGDTEQFVEIDGKRYSHIVDPRTGMPLTSRRSATVIASDGTAADSLTKVASVLEPDRAFPIIEGFGGASALVVRQGAHGLETFASKGFPGLKRTMANKNE
jgi:FAD:protein FMN transferase